MGDPYSRYSASETRGSSVGGGFLGYLSSEAPSLASNHTVGSTSLQGVPSDYLRKDIYPTQPGTHRYDDIAGYGVRPDPVIRSSFPGAYGFNDVAGIGVHSEPVISGVTAGSVNGYTPPLEDPNLISQRLDIGVEISPRPPGISGIRSERPSSLRNAVGTPVPLGESNLLFVDGLPKDCTRREVGHLFRPFIGFKDIKVVHKEPRHSGDKARVLCFVEFTDSKCALTAMEAIQGYKFDDKKPDSPTLRIQFAHFPFQPASNP